MMKLRLFIGLILSYCLLALLPFGEANQADSLERLLQSRRSQNPPISHPWSELHAKTEYPAIHTEPQDGLMQADKIVALPGQPDGVHFDQYSGYVTVNPKAGRALFYYFVESPQNSSTKPLVLWLNGGPGCSSLGYGAMEELGPFRVNSDGKTLFRNNYAWNNVANVIFLESPAGVGFSYSNMSSDYELAGDKSTADDAYAFLVNWLERFPHYKTRDFFIAGESYAGHYVPQLAYTVLQNNKKTNHTIINLKGIAIGNAWIDDFTNAMGLYDYIWTHALSSDEANEAIHNGFNWTDSPVTILPVIKNLMASGLRVWIYSGDIDARVPVTSSRYSINSLKLPIKTPWRPWYTNKEVGGYVVAYEDVTFVTVRGAGHLVPSDQPERALTMISSFLQGSLPPSSP
ncbi:hypothetical protein GH714_011808 [Hevea brasiliensis]|uniref:Carboxypeptidase n=1 Tax=Hevea brasiliensis TaxID=3981 RepID=A0A6A6NCI7_HEVBR|nr:hypothetical protein GH714_011808 [Hevea brasiliensis]